VGLYHSVLFLLATWEREIEYQKLVNAIFLEVFNRQKREKQIAIFDFQCVAKLKKAHERSILHILFIAQFWLNLPVDDRHYLYINDSHFGSKRFP
jgi:hypothetical protein